MATQADYERNKQYIAQMKATQAKQQPYIQNFQAMASGAKLVSIKSSTTEFIPGVGYVKPAEPSPEGTTTVTRIIEPKQPKQEEPKYLVRQLDPFFGPITIVPYSSAPEGWKKNVVVVDTYYPESRALTGMALVTTGAIGVGIPVAGAVGVGLAGGHEAFKYGTTGQHLTVEEVVQTVAIGEMVGIGLLTAREALKPTVQRSIDSSYKASVEKGELWKPTPIQKFSMKIMDTGPSSLAQELVGAGESPPVSFKMLSQKNLGAPEEEYFWDMPTPKSSEVYVAGSVGSRAKMWAGEQLIKRVSGGLSYALIQEELGKEGGSMPYIPKEIFISEAKQVAPAGVSALLLSDIAGSPKASAVNSRAFMLQTQRQSLFQESKQSSVLSDVLDVGQAEQQIQGQKQMLQQIVGQQQTQAQVTTQKQRQEQSMAIVTPSRNMTFLGKFDLGDFGLAGFRKGKSDPFGLFGRAHLQYPIKSAKEMWKWLK